MQGMKISHWRSGFTLVEALVALTILSVALGAIYSTFITGIGAYKKIGMDSSQNYKALLALEKTGKEIRNCIHSSRIPMRGDENSISFCGLMDNGEPGRITYFLNDGGLYRRQEPYPTKKGDSEISKRLALHLIDLEFRYYCFDDAKQGYVWRGSLIDTTALPLFIRIELKLDNKNSISRIVWLPIS